MEEEVSELYFNFPAYKLLLQPLIPLAHFCEVSVFAQFHLLFILGKSGGKTSHLTFVDIFSPYLGLVLYSSS